MSAPKSPGIHADWLLPQWPAPKNVRAVFTSRAGGVSAAPWNSLNLGDHVGDDVAAVAANRTGLQRAIGATPIFLKQVHGVDVARLDSDSLQGQQADACVTVSAGVACTIMVADCLPVLFTDAEGTAVAAAHAGWRGLAGAPVTPGRAPWGVLEAAFKDFKGIAQDGRAQTAINSIANCMAWLGPCIGPLAFEVGPEVKAAFEATTPGASSCFSLIDDSAGHPKYLCNLPGLARLRLQSLGVSRIYGNDGSAPWCTVGNPGQYFSHRRATSQASGLAPAARLASTGRMAACIWLD